MMDNRGGEGRRRTLLSDEQEAADLLVVVSSRGTHGVDALKSLNAERVAECLDQIGIENPSRLVEVFETCFGAFPCEVLCRREWTFVEEAQVPLLAALLERPTTDFFLERVVERLLTASKSGKRAFDLADAALRKAALTKASRILRTLANYDDASVLKQKMLRRLLPEVRDGDALRLLTPEDILDALGHLLIAPEEESVSSSPWLDKALCEQVAPKLLEGPLSPRLFVALNALDDQKNKMRLRLEERCRQSASSEYFNDSKAYREAALNFACRPGVDKEVATSTLRVLLETRHDSSSSSSFDARLEAALEVFGVVQAAKTEETKKVDVFLSREDVFKRQQEARGRLLGGMADSNEDRSESKGAAEDPENNSGDNEAAALDYEAPPQLFSVPDETAASDAEAPTAAPGLLVPGAIVGGNSRLALGALGRAAAPAPTAASGSSPSLGGGTMGLMRGSFVPAAEKFSLGAAASERLQTAAGAPAFSPPQHLQSSFTVGASAFQPGTGVVSSTTTTTTTATSSSLMASSGGGLSGVSSSSSQVGPSAPEARALSMAELMPASQ